MGSVLKIKNEHGEWVSVPAIKGDKGDKGDKGEGAILTDTDKMEIAENVNDLLHDYFSYTEDFGNAGPILNQSCIGGVVYVKTEEEYEELKNITITQSFGGLNATRTRFGLQNIIVFVENKAKALWVSKETIDTGYFIEIDAVQPEEIEAIVNSIVPSWAKSENKPNYTATEVGAYSTTEVDSKIGAINGKISSLTVENQTLATTVEGLQQQLTEEAHFRGYLSTNAKIQALSGTPNDFAYSAESGTKWIYDAVNGWTNTGTSVPDQLTPASNTTPLMNGTASHGSAEAYARGDHVHPTDTTRASVAELNELKSDMESVLTELHNYAQALISGGAN